MSILYTISGCYKCEKVKEVLASKQIPFKEVNLFDYPERTNEIKHINGEVVTPLFYSKGKRYLFDDIVKKSNEINSHN
jgi:glutaredoxin